MSTQNYRYVSQLRAESEARGEARGEAKAVLRVLDRRGIHVPSSVRDQILSCADTAVLEGWLDRALTITSIEDLFD
ncbi:hypothetical protein [Actinomadura alba]|uniref:DUF4351 domain-containing protein n=1 Tax=Actinomadura alba TaxID=406431 RepID=A0ABR7LIZ2_9ACTN|nr:hypothetical protein [Actinomadura alba]MBC6464643.1 hypothetical protein [Actinomadura alba]